MTTSYKSLIDLLNAFPNEESCVKHLENLRWSKGIVCPLCGSSRKFHKISRGNIYKCADCEKSFSVRKGTIFEESRLPLKKWFVAFWLVTSNRKGISSCQLAREVGVTQKTAWFMLGRLREVSASMGLSGGTMSGTVEVDETYMGGKEKNRHAKKKIKKGRGIAGKQAVIGVVERSGKVKANSINGTSRNNLQKFIADNVSIGSTVYTDEHPSYKEMNGFIHDCVNHSMGEYVRGDVHTNGIESFWSLLKRGYYGIFHHFTFKHLHRYIAEFEMRWNMSIFEQEQRVNSMLESVSGLRLTYKRLIA